jgi:hypothetical protein
MTAPQMHAHMLSGLISRCLESNGATLGPFCVKLLFVKISLHLSDRSMAICSNSLVDVLTNVTTRIAKPQPPLTKLNFHHVMNAILFLSN